MCSTGIKLYLDHVCYGYGYVSNDFIILDVVNIMISYNTHFSLITYANDNIDVNVWHMRLDHIGQQKMDRLAKKDLLGHLERVSLPACENFLKEKMERKSFGTGTRSEFSMQLIHSDIYRPMNVWARHGGRYFITFIDDYTRYDHVYSISHKFEALAYFKKFIILVENQLDRNVKTIKTNHGREYLSDEFKQMCEEKGILRQLTIQYTPQQNGVAERRNRTLLEMIRTMMVQANLPITF
jgi:Integrase core domain/GAG-pre-integrase domain